MNEKNDYLEDEEIDLVVLICDMLKGLRKMWLPFLIICILGTISGILYPIFRYTYIPSYRSQAIFSISTSNLYDETNTSYGFYYDAGTASQLENLLPYVLSSDIMQQKLKEELNTETVNGNIRISGVAKSNLFTMEVVSGDAAEAKRILDAALECLPQVSRYVIGETKLNIIEPSNLPVEPIAKRFQRSNPVKGLFLGIGVCIVILLAYAVFRKTIRKENDFRECLNISCLGVIPQVKFKAHRKK